VLLWLAVHDRTVFLRLRNAMVARASWAVRLHDLPGRPPRLAGLGFVDTITEQSAPTASAAAGLRQPVRAMPSLHVGWDLLVGLALVAAAGSVACGPWGASCRRHGGRDRADANHYVLDVLVGRAFGSPAGRWRCARAPPCGARAAAAPVRCRSSEPADDALRARRR
jgi:hypothetical protein